MAPHTRILIRHLVLVGGAAAPLLAGANQSASSITNLGKPTNAVIAYLPLAGFRHTGPPLRAGRLPELLVIGTQEDPNTGVARWPLVKALAQFGGLSGVAVSASTVCPPSPNSPGGICTTSVPTFDWSHARYTSRYVAFVHRDLTDRAGKLYQHLTPAELSLFYRYAAIRKQTYAETVKTTVANTDQTLRIGAEDGRRFPLISIGGYLRTDVGAVTVGDFQPNNVLGQQSSTPIISFTTVQTALRNGKPSGPVTAGLLANINAETNIITALICHADGDRPHSVCGRAVIRQLLKHVK